MLTFATRNSIAVRAKKTIRHKIIEITETFNLNNFNFLKHISVKISVWSTLSNLNSN